MKDVGQKSDEMVALRRAIPYVRLFKGKLFVVKAGGAVLAEEAATRSLVAQVDALHQLGIRVVLVHGGGPQSTALARSLGAEPRFVDGRRVTDDRALEVAALVLNGGVNTALLAVCRSLGVPAIGVSGVDSGLIRARRRPPVARPAGAGGSVDYGHVGDVVGVDGGVLLRLLEAGFVPVVSPLSADDDGALLNINADSVAAALAVELAAEKLVVMTDVPGLLEDPQDPRSLISAIDLAGLGRLRAEGRLAGGMAPKTVAIEQALAGGVRRAHIVSHRVPDSLLAEVFTNEGVGTLVVADLGALAAAEHPAPVG